MRKIDCCNGCVPPKRTLTCHDTCPEYLKQKAERNSEIEALREEQAYHNQSMAVRMDKHIRAKQMRQKRGRK